MPETFNPEEVHYVAQAILRAWEEFGDVPFPLYSSEAEKLAEAAIRAMFERR